VTEVISQYVLKVHSRCDLACNHCYIYEHADQSWRRKPRAISPITAKAAATRIAEHAADHGLPRVQIILHGGEPLLIGRPEMQVVLESLVAAITPVASIDLRVHTNGVLLDEQWCTLFRKFNTRIGVSLDGDKHANDRHRLFRDGRSSYLQVKKALALLRRIEYRDLYAGILCTIDLDNDPIEVYEALIIEQPPSLDLLLPHATWENPPKRPAGTAEPYAAWLLRIYRRWVSDGRPVPIRLFDSLISTAQGGPGKGEMLGLEPVDLLVIDTDGSWEQPDSLKTAFDGAPDTGLNVFGQRVDEVVKQDGFGVRLGGLARLCETCRDCEFVRACGGGLYAHRYRAGTEFDNPTVYCADMKVLVGTIAPRHGRRPAAVTPAATHQLAMDALDALAAGPGTGAAMDTLAAAQLSFSRALLTAVARADVSWQDKDLRRAMEEGWALLCALEADHPDEVAEVVAHPQVQVWAERCLRPPAGCDRDLDRAHLANIAAAVAIRAGVQEQLRLPVRDGHVFAPTVGALRITTPRARTMCVGTGPGRLVADGDPVAWRPTRRLTSGPLRVSLEDLDPFRDCHSWPAASRRTLGQWQSWQRALTAAGDRLVKAVPDYAGVLAVGLRSVVPLRPDADSERGATARQSFGAIALALPHRADALDELVLHEFQHAKLHALTNLQDVFDPEDRTRLAVPWRPDPRPIEGVLHGTYAYLALTHLARAQGPRAHDIYLRYQAWVSSAAVQLVNSSALTAVGRRFVTGIGDAC